MGEHVKWESHGKLQGHSKEMWIETVKTDVECMESQDVESFDQTPEKRVTWSYNGCFLLLLLLHEWLNYLKAMHCGMSLNHNGYSGGY